MRNAYHESPSVWRELLSRGLADDGWDWDWTTLGTLPDPRKKIRARVVAKSDGVWAADGLIDAVNEHPESQGLKIVSKIRNGSRLKKGQIVCEWSGPARTVLAFERPFLNLASYAGGIATRTRKLVDLVEKACPKKTPRVASTRKTLPGYRDVAIAGVLAGGGHAHRISLSGGVLIKENHIAAAGGIAKAIEGAREIAPHLLKIEIEVRDEQELKQALKSRADVIMLDNFSPGQAEKAVKLVSDADYEPVVEISGGLNEKNIADYAIPGIHILSVGSLTHSVEAIDLSLLVD